MLVSLSLPLIMQQQFCRGRSRGCETCNEVHKYWAQNKFFVTGLMKFDTPVARLVCTHLHICSANIYFGSSRLASASARLSAPCCSRKLSQKTTKVLSSSWEIFCHSRGCNIVVFQEGWIGQYRVKPGVARWEWAKEVDNSLRMNQGRRKGSCHHSNH